MKTNHLAWILSLSTLTLAACGAVEPADLGEGSGDQRVAETREPMGSARVPDLYQLSSGPLHVSYTTSGLDGQPHFTYQDAEQRRDFKGGEIRTSTSELGTLATVSIRVTVDAGFTTFTLIVPNVGVDAGDSAPITTQGITATHRFSSVFRHADEGQEELYTFTALSGTAR